MSSTLKALAVAVRNLGTATARRDALIRKAFAEGHSSRDIAESAGLSHSGVIKIARR